MSGSDWRPREGGGVGCSSESTKTCIKASLGAWGGGRRMRSEVILLLGKAAVSSHLTLDQKNTFLCLIKRHCFEAAYPLCIFKFLLMCSKCNILSSTLRDGKIQPDKEEEKSLSGEQQRLRPDKSPTGDEASPPNFVTTVPWTTPLTPEGLPGRGGGPPQK